MCFYINICEYTETRASDADDAKLKPEGRPGWVEGAPGEPPSFAASAEKI